MRLHELLECALAACICMSIEMAADRAGIVLPAATVDVTIDRPDTETRFNVSVRFDAMLRDVDWDMMRAAALASPVARTPGTPVQVVLSSIESMSRTED